MPFIYDFIIKYYDIENKIEFDCKIKGEDVLLKAFVLT